MIMNNVIKTMLEIQLQFYEQWKVGMTTYYKTYVEPFYKSWCEDIENIK